MVVNHFPPGGTDYLELWTDAVIEVAGETETIESTGTFVVNRSSVDPVNKDRIITEILMLNARAETQQFGPVHINLNPELPSMDQKAALFDQPGDDQSGEGTWRFRGSFDVFFEMRILNSGVTLFNKEPVHIEAVTSNLPPIGAIGQTDPTMRIGLYDRANPDGEPVAYMLSTRKMVGQYVELDYQTRSEKREQTRLLADTFAVTGSTVSAEVPA